MGTKQDQLNPPPYSDDTSSREIKSDIRETRSSMDETLDQLGERLHPRNLLDDLIDMFRSSGSNEEGVGQRVSDTVSRTGKSVARTIRDNPVPALLTGAAAVWMVFDNYSDDDESSYSDESRYGGYPRRGRRSAIGAVHGHDVEDYSGEIDNPEFYSGPDDDDSPTVGERLQGAGSTVADGVSSAAGAVASTASSVSSTVAGAASSTASGVAGVAQGAWTGTRRGGRRLTRGARDASARGGERLQSAYEVTRERFDEASENYPVAVGLGFLALGALAGLALPRTRREDRLLGEMSDQFMADAQSVGEDLFDRGKQVAASTAHSALDEAEKGGLGAQSLGDKVRNVATSVKDATVEAAKEEGLHPSQLKEKAGSVASEAKSAAKEESQRHQQELTDQKS